MRTIGSQRLPSTSRGSARAALAGLALTAALAGCAPDANRNIQATGFNGYLNQIGRVCAPLLIGSTELSQMIQYNSVNENYNYFVDVTSRLYYRQMSPDSYRQGVTGFFGPGSSNDRSFQCILANLPANPDPLPPRGVITY